MSLNPEFQLLTLCVQPASEAADHVLADLLTETRLAPFPVSGRKNQVVPFVYRRLDAFSAQIPENVVGILRRHCFDIASWNLLLASELHAVLGLFADHGISAVPFKGPVLALALYGVFSLRQGHDLDIFVDPGDLARAVGLLQRRGYRLAHSDADIGSRQLLASEKDVVLENPSNHVCIELHWAVCEPALHKEIRDFSPCRRACGELELFGTRVRVASPEDTLLMLSVHGMRHYWSRLKWICDITRLVQVYPELDWDRVLSTVDASRRRALLLPHILGHDLLSVAVPDPLIRIAQRDSSLAPIAERIVMDLAGDADAPVWPQCRPVFKQFADIDIAQKIFRLRSKDSLAQRWKLFSKLIREFVQPDAEDLQAWPFLSRMKFIFWIIQPLRIARECGLRFFLRTSRQLLAALME